MLSHDYSCPLMFLIFKLAFKNLMENNSLISANDYNLWYRDQPNNFQPYQECLALLGSNSYKWGDEACNKEENYICQYSM